MPSTILLKCSLNISEMELVVNVVSGTNTATGNEFQVSITPPYKNLTLTFPLELFPLNLFYLALQVK